MIKARVRISTDQFEFIEADVEGTPEEIFNAYKELKRLTLPNEGLPTKEFNAALDHYLNDGNGETEVYMRMSDKQKWLFQEIKKSFNRIEAK